MIASLRDPRSSELQRKKGRPDRGGFLCRVKRLSKISQVQAAPLLARPSFSPLLSQHKLCPALDR
jgi:hypothetical protein